MYNFNALLERMKYIPRWSLMRQNSPEDVSQHTTSMMLIAHTLCELANNRFSHPVRSEKVVLCGLYHDVSEILPGDRPTPVKYNTDKLKSAYKEIETHANERLLETARPEIKESRRPYMMQTDLTDYERKLLKAADKISRLIKCIEEMRSGNKEFSGAYISTLSAIKEMKLAEADWFLDNMVESFSLCLDELAKI